MMRTMMRPRGRQGLALIFTLLLTVVVVGIAVGAIMMLGRGQLISRLQTREAEMVSIADAGLEWARDTINGGGVALPVSGFVTLENGVQVRDASNNVIPGYWRWVYAGRSGNTTGQEGVYASVISVIRDQSSASGRAVVVRHLQLNQESFARFARFDDTTTSSVRFANGITVTGPIHTNQQLYVGFGSTPPEATFFGPVTTAAGITSPANGSFRVGFRTGVPRINLPTTTELETLRTYATPGQLVVTGGSLVGDSIENPATRIEFVPVDVNRDGDFTDDGEGFFRVFQKRVTGTNDTSNYVVADPWQLLPASSGMTGYGANPASVTAASDPNLLSPNCGAEFRFSILGVVATRWMTMDRAYRQVATSLEINPSLTAAQRSDAARDTVREAYRSTTRRKRCYLGGDPRLRGYISTAFGDIENFRWTAADSNVFRRADGVELGRWVQWAGWGGTAPTAVSTGFLHPAFTNGTANVPVGAEMARYLWPINALYNNEARGVIYVDGNVVVSGVLRGRVTIAASGTVVLGDDLTYVTSPGSVPDCRSFGDVQADILGVLTPRFFLIGDNNVNSPFLSPNPGATTAGVYRNGFDETPDETIHGAVLTLRAIKSEHLTAGANAAETCVGGSVGRGCFYLIGAAIQGRNEARMSGSGSGATGWNPQWTYDRCMGRVPPPYYPTTGRYSRNRYFEVDPVGFDVASWFAQAQQN
jgi:Tfp pilus assembly protein PilX